MSEKSIFFWKFFINKKILGLKMTKKNSLQDSLNTLKPIFDFWNSLFQIVYVCETFQFKNAKAKRCWYFQINIFIQIVHFAVIFQVDHEKNIIDRYLKILFHKFTMSFYNVTSWGAWSTVIYHENKKMTLLEYENAKIIK